MSTAIETLGRGRLEAPRWLAMALAVVTVAIIVASIARIAATPAPPAADRGPSAVYPASARADFHDGLVGRGLGHDR